eukprot:382259-Rhodomonas_salina.1
MVDRSQTVLLSVLALCVLSVAGQQCDNDDIPWPSIQCTAQCPGASNRCSGSNVSPLQRISARELLGKSTGSLFLRTGFDGTHFALLPRPPANFPCLQTVESFEFDGRWYCCRCDGASGRLCGISSDPPAPAGTIPATVEMTLAKEPIDVITTLLSHAFQHHAQRHPFLPAIHLFLGGTYSSIAIHMSPTHAPPHLPPSSSIPPLAQHPTPARAHANSRKKLPCSLQSGK